MNERIRELAEQAGAVFEKTNGLNDCPQDSLAGDEIEKFAELIVRECVEICRSEDWEDQQGWGKLYAHNIKKHFEVK